MKTPFTNESIYKMDLIGTVCLMKEKCDSQYMTTQKEFNKLNRMSVANLERLRDELIVEYNKVVTKKA